MITYKNDIDCFRVQVNKKHYPESEITIWPSGKNIVGEIEGTFVITHFLYTTKRVSFYNTLFWIYFCAYIKPPSLKQLNIIEFHR